MPFTGPARNPDFFLFTVCSVWKNLQHLFQITESWLKWENLIFLFDTYHCATLWTVWGFFGQKSYRKSYYWPNIEKNLFLLGHIGLCSKYIFWTNNLMSRHQFLNERNIQKTDFLKSEIQAKDCQLLQFSKTFWNLFVFVMFLMIYL